MCVTLLENFNIANYPLYSMTLIIIIYLIPGILMELRYG
jgi:hypothetical protein